MKKFLFVLLLLCLVLSLGIAQSLDLDMSAGALLGFNYRTNTMKSTLLGEDVTTKSKVPGIGFKAFFDATYLQVALGYASSLDGKATASVNDTTTTTDIEDSYSYMTFSLLGKYPMDMDGFVLFPMAGLEYMGNLSYEDKDGNDQREGMSDDDKKNLNMTIIRFGAGADYDLNDNLFLRGTLLGGYKIKSDDEKDFEDLSDDNSTSTWDFQVNIGVGYKL